jgi:hypothetical protein
MQIAVVIEGQMNLPYEQQLAAALGAGSSIQQHSHERCIAAQRSEFERD